MHANTVNVDSMIDHEEAERQQAPALPDHMTACEMLAMAAITRLVQMQYLSRAELEADGLYSMVRIAGEAIADAMPYIDSVALARIGKGSRYE